ncbi:beta-lactamase family protein [Nocardioides sp. JQ2195]|uniref:serine hydrolase domain-containing protein n=1 Tax=Nocardioides sp. JQ2195 TaxID=2592334 RepID=UPI00143E2D78|nr:serine hydrolase domain-containing protein [Nocardioides sp. JQ2195]QIX27538.1 beta-lactamase family protein [Nocardioides sp. JQ2195]
MTSLRPETAESLRRIVADKQAEGRVPGVVGAVVRDGAMLWGEGVGTADVARSGEPPTVDQQFLIASNSKTFTAVAIMALRDEGKLDLDDTLERFVPECGHAGVTVRQMLAHCSGMQREPVTDVWETLQQPDRRELVEGFAQAERVLRPHHHWHYSNLVYAMLGEVIARLDGREWFDSIKARILDPLGMTRTTLGLQHDPVTGYYVPPFHDVPILEPTFDFAAMAACGGLASTARDLTQWLLFVADPVEEVLSPDTFEEMLQPQIMVDRERWTLAFGLGFMLHRKGERFFVGHTGGMPGHVTGLFTHRESGTGGMVLMNSTSAPDPTQFAVELAEEVISKEPHTRVPWMPGSTVPEEYVGIIGRWYSEGAPFDFVVRAGRLEAHSPTAPAHKGPSVFVKEGDDLYRTESGREAGELLRVTRDSTGRVTKMNWATYVVTREPLAFGAWLSDTTQ